MRVIGIDPDLIAPGFAEVVQGKLVQVESIDFVELVKIPVQQDTVIIVEDIESSKPVYKRKGVSDAGMSRIGQNVGQAKGAANLLVRFLEDAGHCVMRVKPLRGELKLGKKKVPAERQKALFKAYTGWDRRSNEDSRDAAMLALFGAGELVMKAYYQKWQEQKNLTTGLKRTRGARK